MRRRGIAGQRLERGGPSRKVALATLAQWAHLHTPAARLAAGASAAAIFFPQLVMTTSAKTVSGEFVYTNEYLPSVRILETTQKTDYTDQLIQMALGTCHPQRRDGSNTGLGIANAKIAVAAAAAAEE